MTITFNPGKSGLKNIFGILLILNILPGFLLIVNIIGYLLNRTCIFSHNFFGAYLLGVYIESIVIIVSFMIFLVLLLIASLIMWFFESEEVSITFGKGEEEMKSLSYKRDKKISSILKKKWF